tara:strand:+ start:4263 stop:4571 length:309 start_codon:yes stop_codon:yes gene_type:complete
MDIIFTAFTYFVFVITGAIIGGAATRRMASVIVQPLLKELHYAFKHVSAHDLQVYHGIQETDWSTSRPHQRQPKSHEQQMMDADALARELDRQYGDLPPNAE